MTPAIHFNRNSSGGQRRRRPQRDLEHAALRLEPGCEQDHHERHAADQVGGLEIVEHEANRTVLAEQYSNRQKYEQQRRAEASRESSSKDLSSPPRRPGGQDCGQPS